MYHLAFTGARNGVTTTLNAIGQRDVAASATSIHRGRKATFLGSRFNNGFEEDDGEVSAAGKCVRMCACWVFLVGFIVRALKRSVSAIRG